MQLLKKSIGLLLCAMAFATSIYAATENSQNPGAYIDDSVISAKVKAAIFDDPTLKAMDITVVTYKGEVQLSGFVGSVKQAQHAVEVTKAVNGVTSVKNDMRVKDTWNPFYK